MEHECEKQIDIGRLGLMMLFRSYGPMSAKQILALDMGYSKTTLYRLLNSMEEEGIITVVSERKVRAAVEKTYDLSMRADSLMAECSQDRRARA